MMSLNQEGTDFFINGTLKFMVQIAWSSDTEIIEFTSVFLNKLGLKNIIIDINSRELLEEYIKNNLNITEEKHSLKYSER